MLKYENHLYILKSLPVLEKDDTTVTNGWLILHKDSGKIKNPSRRVFHAHLHL